MKLYNRTQHPPDYLPKFDKIHTSTYKRIEAIAAIKDLCLSLEEARSIDDHSVRHESDKLTIVWSLLTHSPHDHIAILMAWNSFRLPVMIDGSSSFHERATKAMEAFLSR